MRISNLFIVIVILSDLHCQVDIVGGFIWSDIVRRNSFTTMQGFQILIPILVLWDYSPYRVITKLVDRVGNSFATKETSVVIIEAKIYGFEVRIMLLSAFC